MNNFFYMVVFAAAVLAMPETLPAAPARYALCVGINRYKEISGLSGCVNDANFMAANLIERGGWDVTVLIDSAATKAAIRGAISRIAAQARAGDSFVYQHSSHGGQLNDNNNDDWPLTGEDGKATFLCVYDEKFSDDTTAYNDYEIAEDLGAFQSGVKVAVIVDACNSGGLFKGSKATKSAAASFDIAGRVSAILDNRRSRLRVRGENASGSISSSEIGWATAAEYYEYSYDGGFYHTDKWLSDQLYGDEYWVPENNDYEFPDSYRIGGVFLASATWGWWTGAADSDADAGDNDGSCDVYEFWKKGYDFCSKVGNFWYGNSHYNYHPQCTNITVLQSIELGWTSMSTPLPELPADAAPERIFSLLVGSADSGLAENITDVEAYSAYRDWAQVVKADGGAEPAGAQAVRESSMAWMSFALGSDKLMDAELESSDVHIARFEPAGGGTAGLFSLEVAIDGVSVGSSAAVPQKTLAENLARIFKVEGSETIAPSRFDSDGIDFRVMPPVNGKARLETSSPSGVGNTFFFRVKME